jgi:intracellular sulfur oxidation DsrE/DsrF family protein
LTLLLGSYTVLAQEPEAAPGFWVTPAIQGFGKMHELPMAAYKPDRTKTYHVVFALTRGSKEPGEVNPALDRVARTVNLYVASGVPLAHLKFVAVASGEATPLALDDAHYRAKFGTANPNLPLIALLRKAGIDVAVCGQAVAEHHFEYEWVDKSVTTALSALTTVTTLEQAGYVLVPL